MGERLDRGFGEWPANVEAVSLRGMGVVVR